MDILELFLDAPEPLSVPEIVRMTGLPRTTVHGLVSTLIGRNYLRRAPGDASRLILGVRVFQLGAVYRDELDLAREGNEVARDVAATCEETVNVAVLDGTDVIYIVTIPSIHSVRMVTRLGRRVPSHCTSLGKMLLSELSDEAFDARFPPGTQLPAQTPHTVTSVAGLKRQITEIRVTGIAREIREINDAMTCIAAPVRDETGTAVAAMSIAIPIMRWDDEREPELRRTLLAGARELSTRLGFRTKGDHVAAGAAQ